MTLTTMVNINILRMGIVDGSELSWYHHDVEERVRAEIEREREREREKAAEGDRMLVGLCVCVCV